MVSFRRVLVSWALVAGAVFHAGESAAQSATASVLQLTPDAAESWVSGVNDANTFSGQVWKSYPYPALLGRPTLWLGVTPVTLEALNGWAVAIDNVGNVTGIAVLDGVGWVVVWRPVASGGWLREQVAAGAAPVAASNDGVIVGWRRVGTSPQHAVVWEKGDSGWVETDLGVGQAEDVNDLGQIVGHGEFFRDGCIWERSAVGWSRTNLGGTAMGINNAGQIVGEAAGGAAVWERVGGTWTVASLTVSGTELDRDRAQDINELGQVIGWRYDPEGWTKAVLWTNSASGWSRQDLPDVGPGWYTPRRINNRGVAIGQVRPNGSGDNVSVRWDIPVPSLPPTQAVAALEAELEAYVTWGVISEQRAAGLFAKLNGAEQNIARGKTTAARNQLNALINEIEAAMSSGEISSASGQALIASVNQLLAGL